MSINLILGPMFSGKSTELLRRYRRYTIARKKCILVKAATDDRYDADKLCTHDEIGETALKCSSLKELQSLVDVTKYDVICIDEVQFFPDAVEELELFANKYHLTIEASGLSGNYLRESFDVVNKLIPKADSVIILNAVCMMCGNDGAPFTFRLGSEDSEIFVGGKESYKAVCRPCFYKNKD